MENHHTCSARWFDLPVNQFDCAAGSQPRLVSRGDLVWPVESSASQEGVATFCRPIVSTPFVGQKSIAVDMSAIVQEHIHVYVCMNRIQNLYCLWTCLCTASHGSITLCRPVVIEYPFCWTEIYPCWNVCNWTATHTCIRVHCTTSQAVIAFCRPVMSSPFVGQKSALVETCANSTVTHTCVHLHIQLVLSPCADL